LQGIRSAGLEASSLLRWGDRMREKVILVQEMLLNGNTKEATIMMLELIVELSTRVEAVESESQRVRENLQAVANGGKIPARAPGGSNGFSIG